MKKKLYRDALMHERMLPEYQTQHEYLALMVCMYLYLYLVYY